MPPRGLKPTMDSLFGGGSVEGRVWLVHARFERHQCVEGGIVDRYLCQGLSPWVALQMVRIGGVTPCGSTQQLVQGGGISNIIMSMAIRQLPDFRQNPRSPETCTPRSTIKQISSH